MVFESQFKYKLGICMDEKNGVNWIVMSFWTVCLFPRVDFNRIVRVYPSFVVLTEDGLGRLPQKVEKKVRRVSFGANVLGKRKRKRVLG